MTPGADRFAPLPASPTDGRTARRLVSRERIENAATMLFAERGYTDTSLDQIAELAGVSKGTIFYNYANKAQLFEQLFMGAVTSLAADICDARDGLTGWAAFERATQRVIERVDEHPAPALIVINELFRSGRPWAAMLVRARDVLIEPLVEIMEEVSAERVAAQGGGPLMPHEHFTNLAMSVLGALVVSTLDRSAFSPERSIGDIHHVLITSVSGLRNGMGAEHHAPGGGVRS